MKVLIVAACVLAVAAANPGLVAGPLAYSAAITSQYHAQDELGQYSYGYQGDTSSKQEVRTADGITRGGYSYLDANGLVQSASYVSDPVNGFRVAATNLPVGPAAPAPAVHAVAAAPVAYAAHAAPIAYAAHAVAPVAVAHGAPLPVADTPEVAAAKAAHFQAHAVARANLLGRKKRSPGLIAPAAVAAYAAPVAAYAAPVATYAAPAAIATYAAPAAVATYAAPAVVPARSFAYSSVAAHPTAYLAAHHGAVVIA